MTAIAYAPTSVEFDPLKNKSYAHTGLGALLADHLASKHRLAGSTLYDRERYVAELALMFPDKTVDEFTPMDLAHFEAVHRDWADATMLTCRSHLRAFFKWCDSWDYIDKNPMRRLEPIKSARAKVYNIFSDAEIARMVTLPVRDGALLALMLYGGLRKGECCRLRIANMVPPDARTPWGQVSIIGGKGGKDRLVPLNERTSRLIAELTLTEGLGLKDHFWYTRPTRGDRTGRRTEMAPQSFQRWWTRVLDLANVPYRNAHMARHTFATRYLRRGGRLDRLSKAMGHASIQTTYDEYAHLDTGDIADDFALIGD